MTELEEPLHRLPGAGSTLDAAGARALIFPLYEGRQLRTGESFADHADGIAQIIRSVHEDPELMAAAYLFGAHDVLRDAAEWIRNRAGAAVAVLVGDLRQLILLSESVRARQADAADAQRHKPQAEALRRMLLAMVNDPRVVVLRLASRLQTMRFVAHNPAAAQSAGSEAIARETLSLFAPLANRLRDVIMVMLEAERSSHAAAA